ncbi:putative iron-regulated membrane protein [Puniceicoccus vermicola]
MIRAAQILNLVLCNTSFLIAALTSLAWFLRLREYPNVLPNSHPPYSMRSNFFPESAILVTIILISFTTGTILLLRRLSWRKRLNKLC